MWLMHLSGCLKWRSLVSLEIVSPVTWEGTVTAEQCSQRVGSQSQLDVDHESESSMSH